MMAQYFLQLRGQTGDLLDPDGLELSTLAAVETAVLENARDVIASGIRDDGVLDLRFRIDAENKVGEVVHSLVFENAFTVVQDAPN